MDDGQNYPVILGFLYVSAMPSHIMTQQNVQYFTRSLTVFHAEVTCNLLIYTAFADRIPRGALYHIESQSQFNIMDNVDNKALKT
jgi:hypothetical protein